MKYWKIAKEFILDLLFPRVCVGCGREGSWLCEVCQEEVRLDVSFVCADCGVLTEKGEFCKGCGKKHSIKGLLYATHFEGVARELVHGLKYDGVQDIAGVIGDLMVARLGDYEFGPNVLLVPVPLHISRQRIRGFNQSECLAKFMGDKLGLEVAENILARVRKTAPQVTFKREERKENILGAFVCKSVDRVAGRVVYVVDDVATTCATLDECARVLKEAGAKEVWGLVFARD